MAAIRDATAPGFGEPSRISGAFEDFQDGGGGRPAAEVAVAPSGAAVAVWAAFDGRRHLVQSNERGAEGGFSSAGDTRSSSAAGASGTDPAVALDASGRATVAWTQDPDAGDAGNPTEVRWSERPAGGGFGPDAGVEAPGAAGLASAAPGLAAAADGTVVGAWVAGTGDARAVQLAARLPGGPFGGHATLPAPPPQGAPAVRANAGGDALVAWAGPSAEAIYTVRRGRGGAVGRVQTAADRATQPPGATVDLGAPELALDDEGNATAVWTVKLGRAGTESYRVVGAGYDAAAPTIVSLVAGGAAPAGLPLLLTAAAVDRWTPVSFAWSFGDDAVATGPEVTHAYRAAGLYGVAVTATDAVGNATVATATLTIGPRLRVRARVIARWVARRRGAVVVLRRLQVRRAPRRAVVRLRCAGARCPVRRATVRRGARRGPIDVARALRPRQRRFRAGQTVTLRITAPARVGKVVRYRLRRGAAPRSQVLCLPFGERRPRRRCAARAQRAARPSDGGAGTSRRAEKPPEAAR
jgi:hypothetical protein